MGNGGSLSYSFHDYAFGMLHGVSSIMVDGQQELQSEDAAGVVEWVKIDSFGDWIFLGSGLWLLQNKRSGFH